MPKISIHSTLPLLSVFAIALGCSDGGNGEVAESGDLPPPIPGVGSGSDGTVVIIPGAGGTDVFDGGTAPLTAAEADLIRHQQCASWVTEVEVEPAMLELVVDTSSSMNEIAPGSGRQTRWQIARAALREHVVGVDGAGLPAQVAVGMLLYPGRESGVSNSPQDPSLCIDLDAMVPPRELGPRDSPHRNAIEQSLETANLLPSTPTHDAYRYALEEALLPAQFEGQKYLLLITDGAPTVSVDCMTESGRVQLAGVDPEPIVEEVRAAAQNHGVRTFLIGVPGSEPNREWMSRAAVLGGTAPPGCSINGGESGSDFCHMDMTTASDFGDALRAGLNKVLGVVSPCTFSYAEPPDGQQIDPEKINVLLSDRGEDTLVIRDDHGECGEGWQLTSGDQILLCPDTCARVQASPEIIVDVSFGCRSYREPPILE
jgi:hypothetical protein